MSGEAILQDLRHRGVHVALDQLRLRYVIVGNEDRASIQAYIATHRTELYGWLLEEMRREATAGLPPSRIDWSEDAREHFEERAAIIELEAGHDRETAELMAEILIRQFRASEVRP